MDETVFAVSCQIFLGDKSRRREETGLTQGWWQDGGLRVSHRGDDPQVDRCSSPAFMAAEAPAPSTGESFSNWADSTNCSRRAIWKIRTSGIWRGSGDGRCSISLPAWCTTNTAERSASASGATTFNPFLQKNFLLFCWKNIHGWQRLGEHFLFSLAGAIVTAWSGDSPSRGSARARSARVPSTSGGDEVEVGRAQRRDAGRSRNFSPLAACLVPRPLLAARRQSRTAARAFCFALSDLSANARGRPFHVLHAARTLVLVRGPRDRYARLRARNSKPIRVEALLREQSSFMFGPPDRDPHLGSIAPHSIHEFQRPEIDWLIQRQTLLRKIDVIQLEYTALGQYARRFNRLVCALFEHDVYFQSVGRSLPFIRSPIEKVKAQFEYLRAIRYELKMLLGMRWSRYAPKRTNSYIKSFLPDLAPRISSGNAGGDRHFVVSVSRRAAPAAHHVVSR